MNGRQTHSFATISHSRLNSTAPKIARPKRTNSPSPGEGGYGEARRSKMTSTTSAARTATLQDDQYNERRHRTIIFSSSWVPQGGMRDLAHLSQVWTANLAAVPSHSKITTCSTMLACSGPLGPLSRTVTGEENCRKMR